MRLPRSLLNAMLAWAARQEDKRNDHRALRGYRRAAQHEYNVDVWVAATDGIHRVLQELARRNPATTETDLYRARVDAAKALLARAGRSRRRRDVAEAKRDLQAAIDKRAGRVSGVAAHKLAELIDDARGNPRQDRFQFEFLLKPSNPFAEELPRPILKPPTFRTDTRETLRALGYATASDALVDAITLCRTAIRAGEGPWREGASGLLAQLLDDYGDAAGAAAARAHLDVSDMVRAALWRADDHYSADSRASKFAPYLVAMLRPTEIVENVQSSALRVPQHPGWNRGGYLILTNERLLFLHDPTVWSYPDVERERYELLAIDRMSIISVRPTRDERGNTWLEIRFPPYADGTAADEGEASALVGQDLYVWLTALSPSH